jgi:dienelactone hydrolase
VVLVATTAVACRRPPPLPEDAPRVPAAYREETARCLGLRCCGAGYGVGGVDAETGGLECRALPAGPQDCFVDHPTMHGEVRACPTGTYMRGLDLDRNLLACCFDLRAGVSPLSPVRTPATAPPFTCPADTVAIGVQADQRRLHCARPLPPDRPGLDVPEAVAIEEVRGWLRLRDRWPRATWARMMRQFLSRLFDLPPTRSYLQAPAYTVVERKVVEGGVLREKIRYAGRPGRRPMYAYLLQPPGHGPDKRAPGALLLHGHFAHAKEGLATAWATPPHALALLLAQQGFVTLAPDTRGWGEFLHETGRTHEERTEDLRLSTTGRYGQLPAFTLHDNMISLSLLAAVPGVTTVSAGGLSLGGVQALWLAALDERVSSVLVASAFLSFACLNDPELTHACQTVPGLSLDPERSAARPLIDAGDLAALVAPRPLMIMWGDQDGLAHLSPPGRAETCRELAVAQARKVYEDLDAESALQIVEVPWMEHEIDTTRAMAFLAGRRPDPALEFAERCDGIPCCPAGSVVTGLHPERELLLCRRHEDLEDCAPVKATGDGGAPTCPAGRVARGADVAGGRLLCCTREDTERTAPRQEPPAGRPPRLIQGLPACPPDRPALVGFEDGGARLLCSH